MLCGYPPFYSENESEVFDLILSMKFEFGEEWDEVGEEVKDLIR